MAKLVLFDIDGTLLRAHGAGGRAMRRAVAALLGDGCHDAVVEMGGGLDPWIFRELAGHGGYSVDDALHAQLRRLYGELLAEELQRAERKLEVLPGVLELLARMRSEPVAVMGLLTGNYAETAALKLRAAGIDPAWFAVAAWGDMAPERPGLVPAALAQLPDTLDPGDVIIVGDTVRDVQCARANGCRCVAVATGGARLSDLAAAGADLVLEDLRDHGPLWRLF